MLVPLRDRQCTFQLEMCRNCEHITRLQVRQVRCPICVNDTHVIVAIASPDIGAELCFYLSLGGILHDHIGEGCLSLQQSLDEDLSIDYFGFQLLLLFFYFICVCIVDFLFHGLDCPSVHA